LGTGTLPLPALPSLEAGFFANVFKTSWAESKDLKMLYFL
jgi:hypothetical protein